MDFSHLFWIFIILTTLQPVLSRKLLEAGRQKMLGKIERDRKSRVVLLVHRQEAMSFLGFPLVRYIDVNDSEELIRAIRLTDDNVPIDLVLHTPGGLVLAATQIARALKRHPAKVTVFVPHYAMSGGTLLALAADEIVLAEEAVLGPVDPQMGQVGAAASIIRAIEKKPIEHVDDATLIMADQARMALKQVRRSVKELLEGRYDPDKIEQLTSALVDGQWTHDYPISCEEARAMGLPVTSGMPEDLLILMSYFRQPTQQSPSVQYLPQKRRAEGSKPA